MSTLASAAPEVLRFQLGPVKEALVELGWTDNAIAYLPKYVRRNLGKLAAAGITPDQWSRWRLRSIKPLSMLVLFAAFDAGLDSDEAASWAAAGGTVAARIEQARWAAQFSLTREDYQRLRWNWGRSESYSDHGAMHQWYEERRRWGVSREVLARWHPRTPIWVLRWATTGEVGDIPPADREPLATEDVWVAAELATVFGDVPMEILAWAGSRWAEGLAGAVAHAAKFDGTGELSHEWVRVQMFPAPKSRRV